MEPIVSIIVPVYNSQDYLVECLDSLTKQTLEDIEIIVVNDGSTDDSLAILERYASCDGRIRVIDQRNGGVSRARNAGMDAARGEYVMFVDSDDYIRLDSCEMLVAYAREAQAEIVVFGGKTFPSTGWADYSFARSKRVCKGVQVLEALFVEPGAVPLMCNKLYSRALLERLGARLPEGLALGEDHVFQLSVFPFAKAVAYTDEVLYFYREHAGSSLGAGDEARDERVVRHLEVVRAIARVWDDAGLIVERGAELLTWFTSFLYNDLPKTSFNVREEVSAGFAELVEERFSKGDVDKLNDAVWERLEDMLFSCRAYDSAPVVTFVIVDETDGALSDENVRSILNQSEQRIRCLIDTRCAGGQAQRVLSRDRRCSMVDLGTLEELLDNVESPYVVLAPTNCLYQHKMLDQALSCIERVGHAGDASWVAPVRAARESRYAEMGDCDVLVIKDNAERIPMVDPFTKVQPATDEPFGLVDMVSFSRLEGWGFAILSLSSANKVFSREFLAMHVPRNDVAPYEAPVQAALAVQFASSVLIRSMPLVTYGLFEYHESAADWALARRIADLIDYRGRIEGSILAGFDEALLRLCLAIDESMPFSPFNPSVARVVSEALDQVGETPVQALTEGEACLVASFAEDDPDEHYVKSLESRCAKAEAHSLENLTDLDALSDQIALLSLQVAEVYNSISYRVGRIVTWPARKGYYGLKRMIRRFQ